MALSDHPTASALAENHFAFMAAQRGEIRRTDTSIELVGQANFLSWWAPLTSSAEMPETTQSVRLFPWNDDSWRDRLHNLAFRPAGQLSYMTAPVRQGELDLPAGVSITAVGSDLDAVVFAETQAEGFRLPEDSDADAEWWQAVFSEEALQNYQDPAQTFYLLTRADEPAAVSLTVTTGDICGIYAVATPPRYRRQGFATLLLEQIFSDAHRRGDAWLTLQVEEGSAAERLYLKAGFTSSFLSTIYQR